MTERDRTLSVCCLTRGPTARVAAQLRPPPRRRRRDRSRTRHIGRIGARASAPRRSRTCSSTTRMFDPVDRPVGWIHSLCTRDWILWVDDDEIPSAAPRQVDPRYSDRGPDGGVTHCFVPRRTLWQDAAHTSSSEAPLGARLPASARWQNDSPDRLVPRASRTGPSRRSGRTATSRRRSTTPTSLLSPVEHRRAKVHRYETAISRPPRRRAADERRVLPAGGPVRA